VLLGLSTIAAIGAARMLDVVRAKSLLAGRVVVFLLGAPS
jgi:hypothetical protein